MTDFETVLTGWATLDEDTLGKPWSWRRGPNLDVRFALYRTLEETQEALVTASAWSHPESRRILAMAQRAFGNVRGQLAGLPTDLLDRAPRDGEWTIRATLRHMLLVERRYATQTRYAVERADSEPVRIPDERQPTVSDKDVEGDVEAILAKLGESRAETNRALGDLTPAAMTRPTVWVGHEVDVRFRLHRFAPHIIEHTVQCEKSLQALDCRPTEGRRIARYVAAALGELEGLGALTEVRAIQARLSERLRDVTR